MKPRHVLLSVGAAALALVPAAAAHVTLNPDAVPTDSFSRFAIRVPTERENASTTKVTVRLPKGLFFVSFQPKPGWRRSVTMQKLDPPAEVFGEQVTERVATVTWEGGTIAPGEFDEFGMSAKVPDAVGTKLTFPAVQTYSNGEIVRWIGPPDADEPAPQVTLEAKEPETTAEPAAQPAATESEEEGEDEGRANLALGLGAAGLVAGLAALVFSPTAAAHGGGGARGYTSRVTAIEPATPGLETRVLDSDDQLALTNRTGKTLTVLGYRGEAYLRFTPDAVFRNRRSPATYLNEERFGDVELPEEADPKATPDWEQVTDEPVYEWHDHRIHWMSPIDPPQVRRAKDQPHHVFDWAVPLRAEAKKVTIRGSLDYDPPPESRFNPLLIAPLTALAAAGAALWWHRRRVTR